MIRSSRSPIVVRLTNSPQRCSPFSSPGTTGLSGKLQVPEQAFSDHSRDEYRSDVEPPLRKTEFFDYVLLFFGYSVFFVRYAVSTSLSSFFPQVADDLHIGPTMNGLIFTSYPVGLTIMSFISPRINLVLGTRTSVFIGLFFSAGFTWLHGIVPDLLSNGMEQYGFAAAYFFNGFTGGLAETGTMIVLTQRFPERSGTIAASIGTICGLGCLAGPALGGVLYDLGWDASWKFRLPFFALTALLVLDAIGILFCFPQIRFAEDEERSLPYRKVISLKNILTFGAIGLNGTIVATLDPTLAYKLDAKPYLFSASKIGLVFMISSLMYIISSIPIGRLADKANEYHWSEASRTHKVIQAFGFYVLAITFGMLGPIWGTETYLDNEPAVYVAMLFKGVGSAGNNAGYPDLVCDVDSEDRILNATICGVWNGVYALGWAIGPILGGTLYEYFEFQGYASSVCCLSTFYGMLLSVFSLPCWPMYQDKIEHYKRFSQD